MDARWNGKQGATIDPSVSGTVKYWWPKLEPSNARAHTLLSLAAGSAQHFGICTDFAIS